MKKSQISIFFIIGILIIVILGFLLFGISEQGRSFLNKEKDDVITQPIVRADVGSFISSCIEYSVSDSISKTGIREETLETYKTEVSLGTKNCANIILSDLKKQNYKIKEGDVDVNAVIHPETISIEVNYPISIKYNGQSMEFDNFYYSFDRTNSINILNGKTDSEVLLKSSNGKAELRIPKDVEVFDEEGNPISKISIKVEDLHFDNLENKYVVGQVVYDNLPEGTHFSEPVEFSIEFDKEDIPDGYSKENIRISYWDEKDETWYAYPSIIKGNLIISNITHFSKWGITYLEPFLLRNYVFKQRFSPSGGSNEEGSGVWLIGGLDGKYTGTAALQKSYNKNSYNQQTLTPGFYEANLKDTELDDGNDYGDIFTTRGLDGFTALEFIYKAPLYQDFKTTFDSFDYISKPILEYGYYFYPDERDFDDRFINCEPETKTTDEKTGISYWVEGGYPKFEYPEIKTKYPGYTCSCNRDSVESSGDCDAECDNKAHNDSLNDGSICIHSQNPRLNSEGINVIDCIKINRDNLEKPGWHNLQCAGGRVIPPPEGPDAADFILFEGNGNKVLGIDTDLRPLVYVATSPHESTISTDTNEVFSFYCEFIEYDEFLVGDMKKINLNDFGEDYLNSADLQQDLSPYVYGIRGVNVIKKVEHPRSRTSLQADCYVNWFVYGNGVVHSNLIDVESNDRNELFIGVNEWKEFGGHIWREIPEIFPIIDTLGIYDDASEWLYGNFMTPDE